MVLKVLSRNVDIVDYLLNGLYISNNKQCDLYFRNGLSVRVTRVSMTKYFFTCTIFITSYLTNIQLSDEGLFS